MARQPSPAISMPPSDGPRAVPIADIAASSPMALPVFSFGTVSPTTAMLSAIRMSARRPCVARAAISSQSVGATPHRTEAAVNRMIPASSSRRRPAMSPSRPTLTIRGGLAGEIVENDPLDLLEGGAERTREGRQADIGDAGAERGQKHGERQAGE